MARVGRILGADLEIAKRSLDIALVTCEGRPIVVSESCLREPSLRPELCETSMDVLKDAE